ncbi:plant disease resistance response protein [Tanacetum coccineum]
MIIFTLLIGALHLGVMNVLATDPVPEEGVHVFELYMHDILGGSNPTARPVTGLLGNIYSGQVPFARRIGFRAPSGLVGTQFAGNFNQNNNNVQNQIAAQLGPDGLGLGFGTITVIDDLLTADAKLGSQSLGKAQGVYVASSGDGSRQMMTFTAMMEGGEYGDSINFFGVYKIGSPMSKLSITGGTGKYLHAWGLRSFGTQRYTSWSDCCRWC